MTLDLDRRRDGGRLAPVFPTLVVGCGGTGVAVVRELKRRLKTKLNAGTRQNPIPPPVTTFLALDTVVLNNPPGQERLTPAEYVYLGGFNAGLVIDTMLRSQGKIYEEINKWWDKQETPPGRIHQGASQMRPIGRLAFFYHFRTFVEKFDARVLDMTRVESIEQTENTGHEVPGRTAKIRVYVVSSLCGGTGSGMFLDVAHWVRMRLKDDAHTVGILPMPSVFVPEVPTDIQRRRVQANAYAALQEVEYFQSRDERYAIHYPGEPADREVARPFDRIFLVDRQSQTPENSAAEALGSLEDVYQLIAQQIFLEIGTDVGSKLWQLEVNSHLQDEKEHRTRRYLAYSGFANSVIEVPSEALKLRLSLRAVRAGLDAVRDGSPRLVENPAARDAIENRAATTIELVDSELGRNELDAALAHIERGLTDQATSLAALRVYTDRLNHPTLGLPAKFKNAQAAKQAERQQQRSGGTQLDAIRDAIGLRRAEVISGGEDDTGLAEQWSKVLEATLNLKVQVDQIASNLDSVMNLAKNTAEAERHWRRQALVQANGKFALRTSALAEDEYDALLNREGLQQEALSGVHSALSPHVLQVSLGRSPLHGSPEFAVGPFARPGPAEQKLRPLVEEAMRWAEEHVPADVYEVLRFGRGSVGDKVRQLFERCRPFIRFRMESGLSPAVLQHIRLVGLSMTGAGADDDTRSRRMREWQDLLVDYDRFELVAASASDEVMASAVLHGLPASALDGIDGLETAAKEFKGLHVHRGIEFAPLGAADGGPVRQGL